MNICWLEDDNVKNNNKQGKIINKIVQELPVITANRSKVVALAVTNVSFIIISAWLVQLL